MYHISDCKKYNRCPRLFVNDRIYEKQVFRPFVRLDEAVTDLAAQKLHLKDYYLGVQNDPPERALAALNDHEWLVKARFEYDRLRIKVPFLHKTDRGWDLYFLFAGLYPHADDMQFYCDTVWVLEGNGIKLNNIRMIHLNADYVRGEQLDADQLFLISDSFYNDRNHPTVRIKDAIAKNRRDLKPLLDAMDAASLDTIKPPVRSPRCASRQKCRFYDICFPEEKVQQNNSILTLISSQHRYQMKKNGITELKNADETLIEGSRQQYAQIMADKQNGLFADGLALHAWLSGIVYPVTFLDFEWERYAIPPYVGMRPYDVLPFEYSIHIMQEDHSLEHKVFLSVKDDRREMVDSMLRDIPETGTVIAYNADGAEKIRINEFAKQFPDAADRLLKINGRMKDLQMPFAGGVIYDTRMSGTWSLKAIMAMMDDPGYKDLDINQGMDAVFQWRHLDREEKGIDAKTIEENLKKYCGMDSYAMAVVYKWLLELDTKWSSDNNKR